MGEPEINMNPTMSKPTKRSNILIGLIKLGLIVIIIVAAYFIYSSISDNNNQELNCSDPNQDGSNRIYVCPQGKTLKLPPDGNLCAGDTCTDTDCCVDIPSVDSSSVRICQRPSTSVLNNYNMTNVQENNLNMDSFDVTGITCNDDYFGEAVATVCTRPGGHYTVSGCTSYDINECDNNPCGEGATCTNNDGGYTCSCGSGYIGDTTDTPCVEKTCSDIDGSNTLAVCGGNATCSEGSTGDGYTCTCDDGFIGTTTTNGPAVCTTKTCEEARGEEIFSCGDGLNIKRNTPCGSNCNNNTCCDYTCGATLLGDNNIGPITDAICSTYIPNSIFRADSTGVNCSEGGCIDSGTIKEADYNNCCTGPPFCSGRANLCGGQGYSFTGQVSSTARCATLNCDSASDFQACCSEWNCRVPTLDENPGYQVTLSELAERPSEVLYSRVDELGIQCSYGYMSSGSSVPSASVCSGDGLNIQLSGCTTGGGVAEVTSVEESPGEWYVGGGGMEPSNANDRKDCNSFCANRRKVCSENTTAEKFSNEINLARFLSTLNVSPELENGYNQVLVRMAAENTEIRRGREVRREACPSGAVQVYDDDVEALAATGGDTGAQFNIVNNSCYRKLYSGADPAKLIPLYCGDGNYQATPHRINVCKCRDPDP